MPLKPSMNWITGAALLLASIGPVPFASGATYYVSQLHPQASDANDGSEAKPWKTIGRSAGAVSAGDTVIVGSGTYREKIDIEHSGSIDRPIRFEADVAAEVVVSGADRPTQWRRESGDGNLFSTTWPYAFLSGPNHAHPDNSRHLLIGRCEQVFVLGFPLRQVLGKDKLARGTFFADLADKRLYAWSADDADLSTPDGPTDASVRDVVWNCKGDYVQVRGLRFCHCANAAQQGAAEFAGKGDVIEDCVFERNNSVGAHFMGADILVRRCIFRENGQAGFEAVRADRLSIADCETRDNNLKNYDRGWEAGGDKIVLSRDVVIEHSTFANNRGTGIWFDIGNENATVHNCLIADNEDAGIFYEISFGLHAHDNVVIGNGFAETPGAWGAGAGIVLSSSAGCVVERNLLVGNKEGFNFREQARTTPRIAAIGTADFNKEEPTWNHDEAIRNNIIAYNRDAQTRGWFDTTDERAWPKSMQEMPRDVSLETLKLSFGGNCYAIKPGQVLFHWGTAWRRNKSYPDMTAVQNELALEQGSRVEPLKFRSYAGRDLRIAADSPAMKSECYPRGDIPGVKMGVDDGK